MALAAIAVVVLVLGVGAFVALRSGDDDPTVDPRSPEGVVAAAVTAIEADDAPGLCRHLTTHAVSQVAPTPGATCPSLAGPILEAVPDDALDDLRIERSVIDGNRATVHARLGDQTQDVQLVRAATVWRVDNIGFVSFLGLSGS